MNLKPFLAMAVILAGCTGQSDVTTDTTDEHAASSQVVEAGGRQGEVYSEAELRADLECTGTIGTEGYATQTHLFYGGSQSKIYAKVTKENDGEQSQVTQTVFTNDRIISWSDGSQTVTEIYAPGEELPLAFFPFLGTTDDSLFPDYFDCRPWQYDESRFTHPEPTESVSLEGFTAG